MFVQKTAVSITVDLSLEVGLALHVTIQLKMTFGIEVVDKVHITLSSQFWYRVMLSASIVSRFVLEPDFAGLIRYLG